MPPFSGVHEAGVNNSHSRRQPPRSSAERTDIDCPPRQRKYFTQPAHALVRHLARRSLGWKTQQKVGVLGVLDFDRVENGTGS